MSIITRDIATNVLDGILDLQGVRRNLDSSTDERRCLTVTPDDIDLYNSIFKYNRGTVSDGKDIKLTDVTVFVRIPVNIHMLDQNSGPEVESYVYTAENRAKAGYASLQVFVDGYKIPDSEIKFYPTKTNVDVFIPNTYLKADSSHEVIVEKKRYDLFPYIHQYISKSASQTVSISLSTTQKEKVNEISGNLERNIQIYVNKKLYNSSRDISFSNNTLEVVLKNNTEQNSEIEIEFDPYAVLYFPATAMKYNDVKNVWEIPESYIDSIHGPISRFSCSFFINNLRVMNDAVEQKGRLHYEYDVTNGVTDNTISFYLSDRNYITDTDLTLYNRDYYLYNFIGCGAVTNALHTTLSGNKFIDEGANKHITYSVARKIGTTKVTLQLPKNVSFNYDGKQKLNVYVYKTRAVSDTRFIIDTEPTLIDPNDYTFDNESDPMTITVTAPSNYFASGTTTFGYIDITSWYSWDYVLNNDKEYYSRENVKNILKKYHDSYDNDSRVAEMLRGRSYLMRTFLENFGYNYEQYTVNYNGVDSYIYLGLPSSYEKSSSRFYDISVNNHHIPNSSINTINKDLTDVFQIEGKHFEKGDNDVSIQVIDSIDLEYKKFEPDEIPDTDGLRTLTVDGFDHLGDYKNNIILLVKVDETNDSIVKFPTSANVGYQLFTDYEFGPYDSDNNTFSIIFNKIPENTFLVYNKNFATAYAYTKPAISSVTDVIIPIYYGTAADPIPYIPRGKIDVYCGNEKYTEGIDYFVKTPESASTIVGSYIIMKRIVLPGSQVDIYMTGFKVNTLYNITGYFNNNEYGLFYLGKLKYPFSTKYTNFYINGQKLGEDDIDILSDKLIRVHSMPIPMYDLVIESTFTVDNSELEPFIQEYYPDDFELYLARLFVGADYSGNTASGSTYDINDIYDSFIDTVDSVNKRKNPVSREGEWIPSYNDDPDLIGPYNDGEALGDKDIYTSIIVGNTYVVAGESGRVASCSINNTNCVWTSYDAEAKMTDGAVFSDGSIFNNENIKSVVLDHGYLIFGTDKGHLVAYGVNSEKWFTSNELKFLNIEGSWVDNTSINGFVVDSTNNLLYMYGDNGTVDAYDWDNQEWFGTGFDQADDVKNTTHSAGTTGMMGNIHTAFITKDSFYNILVVCGENGEIASCYINCDAKNGWRKPNSGLHRVSGGIGPSIYSDGTDRDGNSINSWIDFFNDHVFIGDSSKVTFFNGTSLVKSDILNVCHDGSSMNGLNTYDGISYNEKMMIVGGEKGQIAEYEGESQKWYNCASGLGITSDGKYMQGCNIYTMQLTTGNTNYIIFAGEKGKVCSYNIDVSEVPYRYDPYKSSFLEWYTTPGNAVIQTKWEIPEKVLRMFDMMLESNTDDDSGSICIRGGDNDLMLDIDMNDHDDYPWTLARRRKFMADFIKSLPEGLYSIDQIYELYKESATASHMLYEEDLPVLRPGDEIAGDEDINITE